MFKIDLHIHTCNSGDNSTDPQDVIEQAIEIGLDGIAITEHYSYAASEEVEPLIEKYKGRIVIIRGVEFSTRQGHCLVFGVNTDNLFSRDVDMDMLINKVDSLGGIAIPSHPYRAINSIGDGLFSLTNLRVLEGHNGCNMKFMNDRAIQVSRQLNIPYIGGSDAHTALDVGNCYTVFQRPVNKDNIVESLKEGKYISVDNRGFARILKYIRIGGF
ncbi:MAG: CehA/McbA family metallohydrolase [Thermodesulfovibrionales bacterium]|nr:CehA/McbA family metallohydrolase [Thermodesulfovibrionales bacterium]